MLQHSSWAARDAAPADEPDLDAPSEIDDARKSRDDLIAERDTMRRAWWHEKQRRHSAVRELLASPSGLPEVLASVDDVAAVAGACGLARSDPDTWEHDTGVFVDAALWHDQLDVVYVGTRHGRMVRIDNGCPASVLSHAIIAAIEAARGAQT